MNEVDGILEHFNSSDVSISLDKYLNTILLNVLLPEPGWQSY